MIVVVGSEWKYKCQVCNTLSSTRLQHEQHKAGQEHRKALGPGAGADAAVSNIASPGTPAVEVEEGELPEEEEEGEISAHPSPGTPGSVLTLLCPYCGETVPREGEAAQLHIRQRHRELTFSCKLCNMSARYYYQALEDVYRHLRLRHFGVEDSNKISHVLLPGSQSNLEAFAWVKCKICDFRGIGGGREVRDHLQLHSGSGEENLKIFCRLCHREDTLIVKHFQDFKEFVEHFKAGHGDILRCL